MDPKKVEAIHNWTASTNVKGVRAFIGLANFYRRFIKNFSRIIEPLVAITRKDIKFDWTQDADSAFERLKSTFTRAPVLLFQS